MGSGSPLVERRLLPQVFLSGHSLLHHRRQVNEIFQFGPRKVTLCGTAGHLFLTFQYVAPYDRFHLKENGLRGAGPYEAEDGFIGRMCFPSALV